VFGWSGAPGQVCPLHVRSFSRIRVRGPAAPRGQSLLRSQARCALLPAPSPRVRAGPHLYGVALRYATSRNPLGVACRGAGAATHRGTERRHPRVATALRNRTLDTSTDQSSVTDLLILGAFEQKRSLQPRVRTVTHVRANSVAARACRDAAPWSGGPARTRGDGAGRSAQRACERSSDWPRGAAGPLTRIREKLRTCKGHTWPGAT
jgi:hypothetical protein